MRLVDLSIENFRALTNLELTNLSDAVVLAGPNGCGKSCVLDGVRLLKSAYGSYQQDEWQNWLGEFQINLKREPGELMTLFQDPTKELRISGSFVLSAEEQEYLARNGKDLLEEKAWRDANPDAGLQKRPAERALAANQRINRSRVDKYVIETLPQILLALEQPNQIAQLVLPPLGDAKVSSNLLLELIFSTYQPQVLGIVDYHGPHRNYNRERVGNINLTIESSEQRLRQSALYNYANKYANLKTEMASAYIRHLLSRQIDATAALDDSLTSTLKELFATFFPGKEFVGPQPTVDGRLLFPVRLANGAEHDIDDLSSGEKEVLYGYLRLQNAAPKHSIIMIDEPELHLNPRLVSGLAAFYYRHLGSRLNNQLWLVTHSDTLIREAVSHPHFSVYHIHPPGKNAVAQATVVKAKDDLERVVIDLVGDLAAYRPGAKVVVFESSSDAAFDARMTRTLFPEFEQRANIISAGDKRRVLDLYDLLEKARLAGHIAGRFYAITDSDSEVQSKPGQSHTWDVYHIENYLLHPKYILKVLRAINVSSLTMPSEADVLSNLKKCAAETTTSLIAHRLRVHVNGIVVGSIDLNFDPRRADVAAALTEAIERSKNRLEKIAGTSLHTKMLEELERKFLEECRIDLSGDGWLSRFRGRDILRRFAGEHIQGMAYEYFRDLIISRMSDDHYQPPGMAKVVNLILAD